MRNTLLLGTALLAGAFAFTGAARAAATDSVAVYDNGVLIASGSTATGFLLVPISDANFVGSVTISGVPAIVSPDFASTQLNISSLTYTSAVLTTVATQTGVAFAGTGLITTLTSNLLTAPGATAQFQNWADTSDVAAGALTTNCGLTGAVDTPCTVSATAVNIASATLNSVVVGFGPTFGAVGTGTISETEAIATVFGAPSQSVQLSDAITGVVPEPFSMALLGTGLVGLGVVRRRRAH